MPEMNELKIVERQAQAETQALAARGDRVRPPRCDRDAPAQAHFPRLRRNLDGRRGLTDTLTERTGRRPPAGSPSDAPRWRRT